MTVNVPFVIGRYRVDDALRLLGPADLGSFAPAGCLDHLALVVKNIAILILRVFNYLCGNGEWYNNHTAWEIVRLYVEESRAGHQVDARLEEKVRTLYEALLLRADSNGVLSYGCTFDHYFQSLQQTQMERSIPVVVDEEVIPHTSETHGSQNEDAPDNWGKNALVEQAFEEMIGAVFQLETLKERNDAYSEIAQLQASFNPISALATARRGGGYHYQMVESYCAIAKAEASSYPSKAEIHLQRAQYIAGRIENNENKARAYCALVEVQAGNSSTETKDLFAKAIEVVKLVEDYPNAKLLLRIAKAVASTMPEQASELVQQFLGMYPSRKDDWPREFHICKILAPYSLMHLEQALALANGFENPFLKVRAFCQLAKLQVNRHSAHAEAICRQALDAAQQCCDEFEKNMALVKVVKVFASTNPDQACAVSELILERNKRARALYEIAKALARSNPERALEIAAGIQSPPRRTRAFLEVAKAQAITDPTLARRALQQGFAAYDLIDGRIFRRKNLYYSLVKVLALFDPEQARSKIAEVDQQPCRDKILCLVSQTEALTSVEKGVAIINSIEGVELKIKALCGIARPLVFAEPEKAKELFEKALAIASRCNTHLKYQRKLFSKIISALQD